MSDLSIYDTEGTHVYPPWGPSDEEIAGFVDELATVPPWPVVWYDGDRLYQRMTAVREREEYSTRPNTYYIVVDTGDLDRLNLAAETLSELFADRWRRPSGHDEAHTDPERIRRVWREERRDVSLPTGTTAVLEDGDRVDWQAPDLQAAYGLLGTLSGATGACPMAVTTKTDAVEDAGLVVELTEGEEVTPTTQTRERIDQAAREAREHRAAGAYHAISRGLDDVLEQAREDPTEALNAVVLTAAMDAALEDEDVLDRIISGDPTVAIPDEEAIERNARAFPDVDRDTFRTAREDFGRAVSIYVENADIGGDGIEDVGANIRQMVREAHIEATERYARSVPGMTGDERIYGHKCLEVIRDEYLADLEDPRFRIGAWPLIGRFAGGVPMPSPEDAIETVGDRIDTAERAILAEEFDALDDSVEEFFDEWASFLDRKTSGLRPEYLDASGIFTRSDLVTAAVAPYRRALLAAALLAVLVVLGGVGMLVLG